MKKIIGGIYKVDGDYALSDGLNLYFLYDGINDIKSDVEIDSNSELIDGYCLSINKVKKEWCIKDTGHKSCKDIIAKGKYLEGFEEELKTFLENF